MGERNRSLNAAFYARFRRSLQRLTVVGRDHLYEDLERQSVRYVAHAKP